MGIFCRCASLLVPLLALSLPVAAVSEEASQPVRLPPAEQEAAYLALESVNPDVDWRSLYPDDLCLYGPHGIVCDLFPDNSGLPAVPHIIELNFGYVSDFSSNPACSPNATLPATLSSFPFLRKLFFYACFTSMEACLSSRFWNLSSSLEELVLIENPTLAGRLSGGLVNLPRLRRLVVSGSVISGNIPDEIGNLRNLEQLVLSRNRLHGEIPEQIGACGQLKILDLSGNRIYGPFPAEIGYLKELVKLDLCSNRIAGPVPAEISHLRRLEFLDLSHNHLTGGVPIALAEMASLKEVYLSGNPLGGQIPEIWGHLKGILGLGMSSLRLVGDIPSSMGVFLENVRYLALDHNFLQGELPEQLKRLEATVREINLENNALRGRVPFSAGFVERVGGKLKLAGNPELCLGAHMVSPARRAGLGYLDSCNETQVRHSVLFSSSVSMPSVAPALMVFLIVSMLSSRLGN